MKTTSLGPLLAALMVLQPFAFSLASWSPPQPPPFLETLSPHGTWRNETGYGWYWRPFEADRTSGWRPYLNGGRWEWNGAAWSWISDYVWGETVFRFGRWANVPVKGWIWIPGEDYAPAWVHWVQPEGYWGWAPQPPEPGFAPGFEMSIQLEPGDFVLVPQGTLNRRNLETIAVAGVPPGTPPRAIVLPSVTEPLPQAQPPVHVQQPMYVQQPVHVQPPVYVQPHYPPPVYYGMAPPVVIHETRYAGPSVWWHWNTSVHSCSRCRNRRCTGGCSHAYRDPAPARRTRPAPVPVATHPSSQPRFVPVPSQPDLRTAPIRSGTPVTPNIHRPPPSPSLSRRGAGIQDILEGRR